MSISALEAAKMIDQLSDKIAALENGAERLKTYGEQLYHASLLGKMAEELKEEKTKLENRLKELFI
jgi:predicted nuclease with TOPRIM domain